MFSFVLSERLNASVRVISSWPITPVSPLSKTEKSRLFRAFQSPGVLIRLTFTGLFAAFKNNGV